MTQDHTTTMAKLKPETGPLAEPAVRADNPENNTPAKRRQERLRLRVFEEAARLFEENGGEEGGGLDRTTVEAIAARSDISTRTFFRYFESKTDVIYLDLRRSMEDYVALLSKHLRAGEDPLLAAMSARVEQMALFVQVPGNGQRLRRAFCSRTFRDRHTVWLTTWEQRVAQVLTPYLTERDDPLLHAELITCLALRTSGLASARWSAAPAGKSVVACLVESYVALLELSSRPDLIARLKRMNSAPDREARIESSAPKIKKPARASV